MQTATLEQLAQVRSELKNVRESRRVTAADFEIREVPNGTGGTDALYTGYACVTGVDYRMEDWLGPWTERVAQGAFKRTLADNPDVNFLINHEGMALARTKSGTLQLAEDSHGLHVEARLDPINPSVLALRSAVERGDIDEMSFAFRVNSQTWDETYEDRTINEVNLAHGDVSAVNYGANPHTAGSVSMRKREDETVTNARILSAIDDLITRGELDEATLLALDERFAVIRSLTKTPEPTPERYSTDAARARLALLSH